MKDPSQSLAPENFFHCGVTIDEAVSGFVIDTGRADIGRGACDDFQEVPREEVGIGGEHEKLILLSRPG